MMAPPPKRTVDPSRRFATVSSVRSRISIRDPSSIMRSAPESFAVRTASCGDLHAGPQRTAAPAVNWYNRSVHAHDLELRASPENGSTCHAPYAPRIATAATAAAEAQRTYGGAPCGRQPKQERLRGPRRDEGATAGDALAAVILEEKRRPVRKPAREEVRDERLEAGAASMWSGGSRDVAESPSLARTRSADEEISAWDGSSFRID